MYLLWILAGTIFVFLLIRLFVVNYAIGMTKALVGDRHDDAHEILDTGLVPRRWVIVLGRRPRRRRWFTRRRALRKLRAIIRYFRRTPMVASEDERAAILSRLQSVYAAWESASLDEITPV